MTLKISVIETCIDIPECMMAEEIRHATPADDQLNALTAYMISGLPSTRVDVKEETQAYFPFCDDIVVIDGIVIQGSRIIVPASLKQRVIEKLHNNYISVEK